MLPREIKGKTILISVLDWGMGHLTRCVPLIQTFLDQDNRVVFAGNPFQVEWMRIEFPSISTELIKGFAVRFDGTKSTYLQMLAQSQKLISVYKEEMKEAQLLVDKYSVDVLISDNRYGFRSENAFSIILTHQLSPPIPKLRKLISKKLISFVNKFDTCWIPDKMSSPICEELHSAELEIPKEYIGWLSRFKQSEMEVINDFLFVASGPEPQLSRFTRSISKLLNQTNLSYNIVVPDSLGIPNQVVNPSTMMLNELVLNSKVVISRAGYTTLMEMLALSKKCILVPTPGQYEQEFLAKTVNFEGVAFMSESQLNDYFTSLID